MPNGPCDIALENLERLKSELRKDLETVESRIADIESEGVIKRNRVEELAGILHVLTCSEFNPEEFEEGRDGGIDGEEISQEQKRVRELLEGIVKEFREHYQEQNLTDSYNLFRSRLMMTINALDLVAVALSKNAVLPQHKPAESEKAGPGKHLASRVQLGSSAIIRSQELERHRIAREIHDGPAQAIANVVLRMDILAKVYEKDPSRVPDELSKMKGIAQGALDEIRGFIFDLRPMTLQDLGLVATIKRVVTSLKELSGMDVRFVVEGEERSLGQIATLAVFRITQEAINNIRKHAHCETAWIHLKFLEDKVILIVEDDGSGIDLDEVAQSQKKYASFGLLGMQERADDINADLEIISVPGEGTKIMLVVPTDENPALVTGWIER